MPRRKVYLVSPREPSGATWLINCLLELGVMTYRYSPAGMWRREGGRWLLSPHEQVLRKWLPALSDHASFAFREDVEVQWMHEWFTAEYAHDEVLYFVRDPRDALYSRYKREAPRLSYAEFAAFPDVYTLLDKVTNWWLYNVTWLTHPRLSVFRFEDYKADAAATLANVLDALRLEVDSADIERAVRNSTFERAAAAEALYRKEYPEDAQLINRAGVSMAWMAGGADSDVVERIERVCDNLLRRFGYACVPRPAIRISLERHADRLAFLRHVMGLRQAMTASDGESEDAFVRTASFLATVTASVLSSAPLPEHELRLLRASVQEYLGDLAKSVNTEFDLALKRIGSPAHSALPHLGLPQAIAARFRRLLGTRSQ